MSVLELAVLVLLRVFDLREEEWGVWGGIGSAWIPAWLASGKPEHVIWAAALPELSRYQRNSPRLFLVM